MKYKTEEIPRKDYKYLITIVILVVILFCLPVLLRGDSAPVKPFASEMKSRWVLFAKDFGIKPANECTSYADSVKADTLLRNLLEDNPYTYIFLDTNRTYYSASSITLGRYVNLNFRGSTIHAKLTGENWGIKIKSGCVVENGVIRVDSVGSITGSGEYGPAIVVGQYTYVRTDSCPEYSNWIIRNMTLSTNKVGGHPLCILGNSFNGIVENIHIVNYDTLNSGIQIHYGIDVVTDTDSSTVHPHDIKINNVYIDSLKYPSSDAIYLAAAYNIEISNVTIESCNRGIVNFSGDWGYSRADSGYISDTFSLGTNTLVATNITISDAFTTGIKIDGNGSFTAIDWPMSSKFINCKLSSADTTRTNYGIYTTYCAGVVFDRCNVSWFKYGYLTGPSSSNISIINSEIHHNMEQGIRIHDGTIAPKNILIKNCYIHSNSQRVQTPGSGSFSGIYPFSGTATIEGCSFGVLSGTELQKYGVEQSTSASGYIILKDNYVNSVASGYIGFLVNENNLTGYYAKCSGNRGATGITLFSGLYSDLLDFIEIYQDPTPNDSVVLTFPVFIGDTTYKWIDSSFLTLSSFIDTVCMALVVPYNFHMDSLVFAYKTTGKIDTVAFLVGKTDTRWIADSTLTISGSGTDRTSTTLATVALALSTDLYHGQLVKVKFFNSLTAGENDIVALAYCVIKGYKK